MYYGIVWYRIVLTELGTVAAINCGGLWVEANILFFCFLGPLTAATTVIICPSREISRPPIASRRSALPVL